MKKFLFFLLLVSLLCGSAFAAPLASNARTVIPANIQQIISVDYRALRGSQTAMALKNRVLPENLKQFETALRSFGIDPAKDVEQITFVTYRADKDKPGLSAIGIASGPFKQRDFLLKMKAKGVKPEKYGLSFIYPMGSGLQVVFLDPSTIVFGETGSLKGAIDVRDKDAESLANNNAIDDLISDSDSAPIWSVLDQAGTQYMLRSALGQAASLADYDVVKRRVMSSDYTMNFDSGVTFDLNVKTADNMTAAGLASLLKAGMMYREINATPSEKLALESLTVDSSHDLLKMHFKTDDQRFQALLKSELFASVSH
jgi:hypothetical protein